jgi:hypothetical protein
VSLVVLLLVLCSTVLRVRSAEGDSNFRAAQEQGQSKGLWKSDPALLLYLTERILDADGVTPKDWRADPRLQHPYSTDIPAEFTVGQEFLLAWTQLGLRSIGREAPLDWTARWLFSFLASLSLVGVFGLARELTRRRVDSCMPAFFAALLWAILPANYRTIGFLIVREDLAIPALAWALWLLARAARRDTAGAWFLAGLPLALALSTWHAMGFFLAVLLMAPVAWLLRTGRSPFTHLRSTALLVVPVLATLFVPALRTAGTLGSLPALLTGGLLAAGIAETRGLRHVTRVACAGGAAGLVLILAGALRLARGTAGAYSHVYDVLFAKLRTLGHAPEDPTEISFDARLLWQGPFETLPPASFVGYLGWGMLFCLLGFVLAWWGWGPAATQAKVSQSGSDRPGTRDVSTAEALLVAASLFSLPAAWLVARVVVLPGLLLPVLAATLLARAWQTKGKTGGVSPALLLGGGVLFLQGALLFLPWIWGFTSPWYQPAGRQAEIAALVDWVSENVEPTEAISADFMNGPAILAHCGNGIVLQPKYETDRSRRQAERFLEEFFHGSPAEFLSLIRGEFKTRYVLIDRYTLGFLSRWAAGLRDDADLVPGTAAELFLSQDTERLESIAGTTLVYRSPESIQQSNGAAYDFFCLYRLD